MKEKGGEGSREAERKSKSETKRGFLALCSNAKTTQSSVGNSGRILVGRSNVGIRGFCWH